MSLRANLAWQKQHKNKMINTFWNTLLCTWALFGLAACQDAIAAKEQDTDQSPHIVILIADDLGLARAPCFAADSPMEFLTVQCDKAVVFERAYTHPYCTASRAAMMTARHTFRHGAGDVRSFARKLPLSEVTIPEYLKANGASQYRFSAIGKWHLADDENGSDQNPNLQGFDHFAGTPRQHHTYKYYDYDWVEDGKLMGRETTYKTTKIANSIISDFEQFGDKGPQFYWVGFVNPHMPFHTPPAALHSNRDLPVDFMAKMVRHNDTQGNEFKINRRDPKLDPYFVAMLEALDTEIARIVTTLSAQSDRPIVFMFLGDNGTSAEVYPGDRSIGYRAKAFLYDGGTRIPLMVWSTGKTNRSALIQPGRVNDLVHLVDLLPTLADLVGAKPVEAASGAARQIDGQSFISKLSGTPDVGSQAREFLYVERGNAAKIPFAYGAVNQNGLKLILRDKQRYVHWPWNALIEVYDTKNDPQEAHNLFKQPCSLDTDDVRALYDFIRAKLASEPDNHTSFTEDDYGAEFADFYRTCEH